MKKMKPETAGTTIIGSRKNTVTRPAPPERLQQEQREREAEHELDCHGDDRDQTVRQSPPRTRRW